MLIRKTTLADVDAAAQIYDDAREFMREAGNPTQWADGYPNRDTIIEDIENGVSYVCEENGEILAVFMFKIGTDPVYEELHEGMWLDREPYAVIHRIAVSKGSHGRGVAAFIFDECFKRYPNLKVDTHRDNHPMQSALYRAGFHACGLVYLENGDERVAFHKNSERKY